MLQNNNFLCEDGHTNSGNQIFINTSGGNSPVNIIISKVDVAPSKKATFDTEPQLSFTTLVNNKQRKLLMPAILAIVDVLLWMVNVYSSEDSTYTLIFTLILFIALLVMVALVIYKIFQK